MKILPFGTPISSAPGLQPAASYIGVSSCYAVVNLRFCPETTVPGFFGYRASDLLVASVLLSDFRIRFALLLLAESGGLNGVFYHLIASQPKAAPFRFVLSDGSMGVFHHLIASLLAPQSSGRPIFRPLLLAESGGLKWTRTIDLTLIRRVL